MNGMLPSLIAAGFVAWCCAGTVLAADPGWFVQLIDTAGVIDSLADADNVLDGSNPIEEVATAIRQEVNLRGGVFPTNDGYPNGVFDASMGDFVVQAWADVVIPAGDWSLGFGSDDGARLSVPGVEFLPSRNLMTGAVNTEGPHGYVDYRVPRPGNDAVRPGELSFDGIRPYNWNWADFSLETPLSTQLSAIMYERGGTDALEVAILNRHSLGSTPPNSETWRLLANGVHEWQVTVPDQIPSATLSIGGEQSTGTHALGGELVDRSTAPVKGIQSGLLQHWFDVPNPGSYAGVLEVFDPNGPSASNRTPVVPPFHGTTTWWTGNVDQFAQPGTINGLPQYPREIVGVGRFNEADNSNYTVVLTGELLIPESGTFRFADGIDDLTVLGIDLNRDGVVAPADELLINDNLWTSLNREAHDGGEGWAEVSLDDVPVGGDWYKIEVFVAEGGGDDAGIIYWDYDIEDVDQDGVRLGDAAGFPSSNGGAARVIPDNALSELFIPESHLRSEGGQRLSGGTVRTTLLDDLVYRFEIDANGNADTLEVTRPIDVLTTTLDLNGTTLEIQTLGTPNSGEYTLFVADDVVGEAMVLLPDPQSAWDTTRLFSDGILVRRADSDLLDCNGDGVISVSDANCVVDLDQLLGELELEKGDLDGDGVVQFADFLRLSDNFGRVGAYTDGDLDGDSEIGFADFLILSTNFGRSLTVVPEPSSWPATVLLMWMLMVRRAPKCNLSSGMSQQ